MGMSKNLMIEKFPEEEDEEDDFDLFLSTTADSPEAKNAQADDWARITSLGLPLPLPEDYQPEPIYHIGRVSSSLRSSSADSPGRTNR
jgi:hypothetical protein